MAKGNGSSEVVEFSDRKAEAKTFEYPVEVQLTDKELLALGQEVVSLDAKTAALESRFAEEKTKYKNEQAGIDGQRGRVIEKLRTKKETRTMQCWDDFDMTDGICTIRRSDTDEPVKTRRMRPEEFKRPLPFNRKPQPDQSA